MWDVAGVDYKNQFNSCLLRCRLKGVVANLNINTNTKHD